MEEQVSDLGDLKGLNSELEGFLSELHEKEQGYSSRLVELEAELADARAAAESAAARLAEQEASLSTALQETRSALSEENLRSAALAAERNDLVGRLESVSRLLDEEKARSAEKDLFISSSRSAVKDKEAEGEKVWRAMEELKAELSAERSAVKEKDAQLQTISKIRENLEQGLEQAARDSARSEEGFSLKLDLIRNDLKEQAKRTGDLERKLAAAGNRLDEALEEAAHKGRLLEESRAALAEKEASLKAANQRARDLAAEAEALRGGRGRENPERAREMAAALSARIEELELELAERSSEGLEKVRASQAALSSALSELRKKDEELAGVRGRESALLKDIEDAEEKWKLSSAQLHNAVSKLRAAENENEIGASRVKTLEAERDKFRAAAIKAEAAASELASREAVARDGEAAGLLAALEEQSAKYAELMRKYDGLVLSGEALAREKAAARTEADSLRARLEAADSEASGAEASERERSAQLFERVRSADAALKKKELDLEEERSARAAAEADAAALRSREQSLLREMEDAEEKWKFSTAQLHNYVSKVRAAENENEINAGLIKTLEAERDKFRAAAVKAEATASGLASREAVARDGETAGLLAALEEQSAKYAELLRKYDDLILSRDALAREKTAAGTEADSLRARLEAVENGFSGAAASERERNAQLFEKARGADALLKKKDIELQEERSARTAAETEAAALRAYLQSMEAAAAGAAEQEKARYEKLSEQMQNAGALLKSKEQELKEARGALAGLENECSLLRRSRLALNEKYAREIQAENGLIEEAQARVLERDSELARLSAAEKELKEEAETLRREKQELLSVVRRKAAPDSSARISEAERLLDKKEKNLNKLRGELEEARLEKAELQAREKKLRDELKTRPYRAAVREAEEKLVIKEKMLAELNSRMKKLGGDFEELKQRGKSAGAPGYLPDFEELVAGVAHQVANSISIIRSHAEFCAEAPEAEGARESLAVIVRNIVGLQNKIDKIMNFSRPVIPQRSPELLEAIAAEELERLRGAGRLDGIKAVITASGGLKPLSVDRVRLAAAVEQLLTNAVEAMPGGGELGIKVSSSGGKQRLEISDGGEGIEKKNLESVFHPFFTTRPGKMGLGLTLARNVAKAHGGTLELFSTHGGGARAVIELPEV